VSTMVIYLGIAAGLVTLSLLLRVIRFALGIVLVALVVDLATGHGAATATQLAHLL
jgi:sorbitol-specific phosphotransferase system component IIC